MNNIEITHNNKLLSLFHINACSLNKNFDIIAISETRITKQISLLNNLNLNNYSFEFTPTETSAGGTLLYIANYLSYKCCNDFMKKPNILVGVIYRHPSIYGSC